ncbi:MAG TPA: hypothetical protein VKW78_23340 [Terriglobales bacterium]|jgi:hypothetical protein|nr:hypothetical protein [Terriglobales bacterium]
MTLHNVTSEVDIRSRSGISPATPPDILELRAVEQRERLHQTLVELRSGVRQKLDIRSQAREYVWPASVVAALLSLAFGYTAGSVIHRGLR